MDFQYWVVGFLHAVAFAAFFFSIPLITFN